MPETEQQDKTLSELVVKEAIGKGLDSPMRDSILEAVNEADESREQRSLTLAAGAFGLGAALGFLAGRESPSLEETPLSDVEEPEIIEDVMEESPVDEAMETAEAVTGESEEEGKPASRLLRLVLVLGAVAGVAYLRRRFASEEEEWEPIEEFKPATDLAEEAEEAMEMDEGEDEAEGEETEAEEDEDEDGESSAEDEDDETEE